MAANAQVHNQKATQNCLYCGGLSWSGPYCCSACETLQTKLGPLPILDLKTNSFGYYDSPEFRELYKQSSEGGDYVFFAEGLHCSSCVHLLEKLPQFYSEIHSARVNFSSSTVAVKLSTQASLAQVAYVIQELGYKPTLLSSSDNIHEKFIQENRTALKRIAVAGFCAGNTMLFVVPVYAGLAGSWAQMFNALSFLLFLPILLYSARPFYQGAWNALKYQVMNVDLPIVIAMLSGFLLSTVNLVRGSGDVYYDSTASFLFFILSARYLLKRVQQNYLSTSDFKTTLQDEKYEVQESQGVVIQSWKTLKAGQVLNVKQGQALPADAELLSSHATLDLSLFSGESMPKVFTKGMPVFSGAKVLDHSIQVKLKLEFNDSRLGLLLKKLDDSVLNKSPFIMLTDRLAQKLILYVFAIAILFFALYFFVDPVAAFNRSLALIVLACPCALAFGSPLTFALALKKAQKSGILLKDGAVLEKLLKVKNIFLDKTGTLTEGSLDLVYSEPANIPSDLQNIILSLEATSYHPVAFALRKAWRHPQELYLVQNSQETLGQGVRGIIENSLYEIRTLSESTHETEIAIEVLKDHKSIARLYFADDLREDSLEVLKDLRSQGLECFLLSGDKKARVLEVARKCGISESQAYFELFPEDKMRLVAAFKDSCMIGDGANDSLSLKKADVGIAVKGSVDLSLQNADVYLTCGGLRPVLELLKLSKKTREVLVRNLALSLVYNSVGGVLALMGFINPMMAAILMPISSVAIILSTLWGFK